MNIPPSGQYRAVHGSRAVFAGTCLVLAAAGCTADRHVILPRLASSTAGSPSQTAPPIKNSSTFPPTAAPTPSVLIAPTSTRPLGIQPTTVPASGAASSVEITWVELGPEDPAPGGQFVVLRNTGSRPVDLGCWHLSGARRGSGGFIGDVRVAPRSLVRLSTTATLFRSPDQLLLQDPAGRVVDRTPDLVDNSGDDRLWIRTANAWTFGRTSYDGPVTNGDLGSRRDCAG